MDYSKLTEDELVEYSKARDEAAFSELVKRTKGLIHTMVARKLPVGDVDDVVSIVFIEIWDKLHTYDPAKGKFKGWAVSCATKRAIDYGRKSAAYWKAKDRFEVFSTTDFAAKENNPEVEVSELRKVICNCLTKIPYFQAQALEAFIDGLPL